jgi:hypothetical protein
MKNQVEIGKNKPNHPYMAYRPSDSTMQQFNASSADIGEDRRTSDAFRPHFRPQWMSSSINLELF